jgi:hypothetical protein
MVGLSNVDDTSDADKPVSSVQQAALNLKAPLASPAFTGTVTAPTVASSDNSINVATTAYVTTAISAVVDPKLTPGSSNLVVSNNELITVTNSYHTLTCSDSSGNLSTINGGSIGSLLHIDAVYDKTITVTENGNILLTSSPYGITNKQSLTLIKKTNYDWYELFRTTLDLPKEASISVTNAILYANGDESTSIDDNVNLTANVSTNSSGQLTFTYNGTTITNPSEYEVNFEGTRTITVSVAATPVRRSNSKTFLVSKYPVVRDVNGVTYEFIGTVPENATNPFFVKGYNDQYYAVMKNTGAYSNTSTDSVVIVSDYANGNTVPFIHNGQVIPIDRIVTTLMTSFQALFYYVDNFNGNVTTWDTKNVTTFANAFQANQYVGGIFNQDISKWNTSNVTNMDALLFAQGYFNQDISNWNVDNVTTFSNLGYTNYPKLPPKLRLNPFLNNFQNINKALGASAFDLTPPATYSLGSFSYTSSNLSVATISGNTVTIVGVGSATITATQAYDLNHRSASISATLTVI